MASEYYDFEMEKWGNTIEHFIKKFSEGYKSTFRQGNCSKDVKNCPKDMWQRKQSLAAISVKSCFQNFLKNPTLKL